MARARKPVGTKFTLQGFSRVMLKKGKKIVGDSGWCGPNMITNDGIHAFVLDLMGAGAHSLQIQAIALGSGGTVASDAASLPGEYGGAAGKRVAATLATTQRAASNGTGTMQFSGTWSSTKHAGNSNLSNIGLFNVSNAAGSMFCANTYASSTWASNQDIYCTYQVRVSFS